MKSIANISVLFFALLGMYGASFLITQAAHASFIITEIQYNPEGSDSGYEWIEVQNTSDTSQDLREYFFRESGVNHRITSDVHETVPAGAHVVIADKPENIESPGAVYDSSFSLVNTGELLEIISPEGTISNGYTYDPSLGGSGDGSTLSLIGESFVSGSPTPGTENKIYEVSDQNTPEASVEDDQTETQTQQPEPSIPSHVINQQDVMAKSIDFSLGGPRYVMAHVPYEFQTAEEPRYSYTWNFGDGNTAEGSNTSHTYQFPGEYTLALTVKKGQESKTKTTNITVIEPSFSLETKGPLLTFTNNTPHTVSVENFLLQQGSSAFSFPEGSYMGPRRSIQLDKHMLGLAGEDATESITFQTPSGATIAEFNEVLQALQNQIILTEEKNIPESATEEVPLERREGLPTDVSPENILPTSETKPFISTHRAEASEIIPVPQKDGTGLNPADVVIIVLLLLSSLVYLGHRYFVRTNKTKKPYVFEDINLR